MGKVYIVVEANWEYDDQYYSRSGSRYGTNGVGVNKRVFKSKASAEQCARSLNIKEVKGADLGSYAGEGNDISDICLPDKYSKLCELLTGDPLADLEWDNTRIPNNLSDEKAGEILDCLNIGWYEVQEFDAED
jgi:hypothetical protein